MKLSSIKRLVLQDPADWWGADLIFVPLAVFIGLTVKDATDSWLIGFLALLAVMGVRYLLFLGMVKPRRKRNHVQPSSAASDRDPS